MRAFISMTLEAANIFESSVNFYQATRPKNPGDKHLNKILRLLQAVEL
jgi:hypothetical protein